MYYKPTKSNQNRWSHFLDAVRDHLNRCFKQRWIGRGCLIAWPPQSPDITLLDFLYGVSGVSDPCRYYGRSTCTSSGRCKWDSTNARCNWESVLEHESEVQSVQRAELILQPFRHFTYVTTHSPTHPSLYLRHSSFSNTSDTSPTSQYILQPFFRSSCVTSSSPNSPGEPPMLNIFINLDVPVWSVGMIVCVF